MTPFSLLLLPGDGIGPEIVEVAQLVIENIASISGRDIVIDREIAGGASIDQFGHPLRPVVLEKARQSDAVLIGAMGGPQWDFLPTDRRAAIALLTLRKELGLFANIRPVRAFPALLDASSLRPEIVRNVDMVIVRELVGGIYFGEPRGIEELVGGGKRGFNTETYSSDEVSRIGETAFELAKLRSGRVHSVDKANVLEASVVWRDAITNLHLAKFSDVDLDHMFVDNAAMQLVRDPKQFDVIVTGNIFGDILSDCAAMLSGSIGILPSASIGAKPSKGRRQGLYEPVHGTAPDIAGQGLANPIGTILSAAMMFEMSCDMPEEARLIEHAVEAALESGARTKDIANSGEFISTREMGEEIVRQIHVIASI